VPAADRGVLVDVDVSVAIAGIVIEAARSGIGLRPPSPLRSRLPPSWPLRYPRFVRALAIVVVISCGSPHDAPVDAPVAIDTPPFPATIDLAATQTTIAVPFHTDASGSAGAPIGAIAMAGDVGTITGVGAFAYGTVQFSGYQLFYGFTVDASHWNVFWLYCMGSGIADVYLEGVDGPPLFFETATGTCTSTQVAATPSVSLPALSLAAPAGVTGYRVAGSDIYVGPDGRGQLVVAGTALPLRVFGTVDCSTRCGSPGWYELHSVVWDDASHRATFVIVYLLQSDPTSVELAYARSLPDLGDPFGAQILPATWSATPSAHTERGPVFGMPPPALRQPGRGGAS
jgi:hypothetical protein